MNRTARLLAIALAALAAAGEAAAQTVPEQIVLYRKGGNGVSNEGFYMSGVDSVTFCDTDYDISVECRKVAVNESGQAEATLSLSRGMSVARTRVALVDTATTETQVLAALLNDGLRGMTDVDSTWAVTLPCPDRGAWKAVALAYDEGGKYRGMAMSGPQSLERTLDRQMTGQMSEGVRGRGEAYDWGYGAAMRVRDVMGEECLHATSDYATSGYDWFATWERCRPLGPNYAAAQTVWLLHEKSILGVNAAIANLQRLAGASHKPRLGAALALRALYYLDFARMYEFLPNDATPCVNESGNDVTGLTVPIVTAPATDEHALSKDTIRAPRATREEMAAFVMGDLDEAETLLTAACWPDKTLPDLGVVYGLKARLCLWQEKWREARQWARRAIDLGGHSPLTRDEWLSTATGFNDRHAASWMMALMQTADTWAVQSGIANWVSWCCNEQDFGYTGPGFGLYSMAGKSFYDSMADTDLRKLSFKAPQGSALSGREPRVSEELYAQMPAYAALKFRPGASVAGNPRVVDVPLMRVEEMHFISMECLAQQGLTAAAKEELQDFMSAWRQPGYTCQAATKRDLIDEIVRQKRAEFWGEGLNFFDYKRLDLPVTRAYDGTNWWEEARMNTTTRPAWMNLVIPARTGQTNTALEGWNNPDPTGKYTPIYN